MFPGTPWICTVSPDRTFAIVIGRNFSQSCLSPNRVIPFTMTTGRPYARQYEIAMASCAALDAAYGLLGITGDHSAWDCPGITGPYTSSVDIIRTICGRARRQYSSVLRITSTLFRTKETGSVSDRST